MLVDTQLISCGAALAVCGVGFARGHSVASIDLSNGESIRKHIGSGLEYIATQVGAGLTWWGTFKANQPLLHKPDVGAAIAVLQANAVFQGVSLGLAAGFVAGFIVKKAFGRFFD